jgi:hypothetical protein
LVAFSEELGSAIEIESLSFQVFSGSKVHLGGLQIYLGLTNLTELGKNFEANYTSGTKTLVYNHGDMWLNAGSPGEWFTIDLDNSYWYNGTDNLIIEFGWPSGDEAIYVWGWTGDVNRSVYGLYGETTGSVSKESILMRLNGTLALEAATFGAIKATLGSGSADR